jgi:hypothetical protein
MKIEDLLVQSQVDEGVGSFIGKGLGAVGKGIGAVASVPQGIGRAIKKGYQSGVATIGGDDPTSTTPAGTAAPAQSTTTQAAPAQGGFGAGLSNLGASLAGATGVPTAGNGGAAGVAAAGTNAAAAGNTAGVANVSLLQDKKFMGSLQALKGGDVEKVRAVLQSRAAVAEDLDEGLRSIASQTGQALQNWLASKGLAYDAAGIKAGIAQMPADLKRVAQQTYRGLIKKPASYINKAVAAAPDTLGNLAGKAGATGTRFSQAYQNARGGYMTIQDLQRSIAAMSPKDAGEALQFFNSIHPGVAPAAATGTGGLNVVDGGKAVAQEGIDELASMKNMLDILKKR